MKQNKPRKSLQKQLVSQFYHKNKIAFGIAVIGALLAGSLNLILSWLLQQLLDAASGVPGAMALSALLKLSLGFVLLCVVVYLINYASKPRFIAKAMRQYKDFAFQKLTEKNISTFHDENTAAYISALSNDAASIEANYLTQQLSLITTAVMFVGAFALMLAYSPLMTAIAVGLTVLPFAASILTGNRLAAAERQVSDKNAEFTATVKDCLSGFSVVKSFKAEKEIYELFAKSNASLEQQKYTRERIKTLVGMIGSVAGIFAQLGVFVAGAYFALSGGAITPGVVIVFVNLMNFVIQPIAEMPGLLAGRRAALGLIGKLADALEQNVAPQGTKQLPPLQTGITMNHVSFGYGEDKEVLHNISTTFEAGKCYAIVGGSGSGKSTLLNLIMAAREDYEGEICYDDAELRQINGDSLYDMVSVIQQNVFVFNASIRDNITMFRNFPAPEVETAIQHAHLDRLLEERSDDYLCGENGKGLSGGEKQRISIARSLLKKASVLLVDEATAALDAQTAYQVTSDILGLEGMTRIVVTHALDEALLKQYDSILALKDGRIVESGSFDELIAKKGYFYALCTVAA